MRFAKYVLSAALAGAALLASNGATATVVAQDLSGTEMSSTGFTWGESFVTPSGSSFHDITINFYAASGGTLAAGTGYLFAAGTTALSRAGALAASVSSAGGVWRFASNLKLASGTRYYFYEDTPLPSLMGDAGGVLGESTVTKGAPNDVNYTVNGFAVPEPGPWSLMLAGVALTGLGLRSRRVAAS